MKRNNNIVVRCCYVCSRCGWEGDTKIQKLVVIDNVTSSRRKYNNASFGLLRELDLKFNFGLFVPDKELFKELD